MIHLALKDLPRNKPFEQWPEERGPIQLSLSHDSQKMTGQAGVAQIYLGRLDKTLAEVLEIRRNDDNLTCDLENLQPLTNGRHRYPKWSSQIALVHHLPMPTCHQSQKTPERRQVPYVRNGTDIAFQIGLDVGTEPQLPALRPRHRFRISAMQQGDSIGLPHA
jgi:hypothetical protein